MKSYFVLLFPSVSNGLLLIKLIIELEYKRMFFQCIKQRNSTAVNNINHAFKQTFWIREEIGTFRGAVRVPSTSNKAINPGFLAAIAVQNLSAIRTTNLRRVSPFGAVGGKRKERNIWEKREEGLCFLTNMVGWVKKAKHDFTFPFLHFFLEINFSFLSPSLAYSAKW